MINLGKLFSRIHEAPARVVLESSGASFIGSSILAYGVIGPEDFPAAGAQVALLTVVGAVYIVMAWVADPDLWEAVCRPFERSARIDKQKDEERKKREEAERAARKAEEEAEQARRVHLWKLTKHDRDE